jgi:hypothetical protein
LKTKSIPATQQKPSPVNNYGDWGDGEAIAGSVAIWWRGGRGVVSVGVNLSPNLEASRERFATCRCRSHGNQEVLSFQALTVGQAEDIMMRQAEKITDPEQLPIGLLLAQGLQNTFPCDEKH